MNNQTKNQHSITPPTELVEQWYDAIDNSSTSWKQELATKAARWGADLELEANRDYMQNKGFHALAKQLLAARRPKPPSSAEEALDALEQIDGWAVSNMNHLSIHDDLVTGVEAIRRALERLQELEKGNE